SRLLYDLPEIESKRYALVLLAAEHLSKSQQLWRIVQEVAANQPKVHAGASSLVARRRVRVGRLPIPKVTVNISTTGFAVDTVTTSVICIDMDEIKLFLLPDMILYWQRGTFANIAYEALTVKQSTTTFIENEPVP